MHFRPPYRAAGDRVYQAIKARLVAYEFPQGERIYLERIANTLGVSTTPVREAMNRLAERDLVIRAENKGFFAMTLSETRLRGYYELTGLLLTLGLEDLRPAALREMRNYEPIATILNRLDRRAISDFGTLAHYTAETFAAMAALIDNPVIQLTVDRANDHLYFARTLECRHIAAVQSELKRFCELFLAGQRDELVAAINVYHEQRIALLPALLRDVTR